MPNSRIDPGEEELPGGGSARVVRVGDTVRRNVRPWSDTVRRLLNHLSQAGVTGVPRWRGIDANRREILDYLPGEVGNYPLSENVRSEQALTSAARLLRTLHDATTDLAGRLGGGWQLPALTPVEVICHGDFAPYNCVFRGCEAVGVIDFDFARPGPRRWDIAYALYRFAPLSHPDNGDGFGDSGEQGRRACLFLDAYGVEVDERPMVVRTVAPRLRFLVDHMHDAAAAGDENFRRHLRDGHADLYLRDILYLEEHLDEWIRLVTSWGPRGVPR